MSTSTTTVLSKTHGADSDVADEDAEAAVRLVAARAGLRLERSRRLNDQSSGPTLYWLFDVQSTGTVSSQSGWTLERVRRYLTG